LWICDRNTTGIAPERYRRCWPYHLAMQPAYRLLAAGGREKMALLMFGLWTAWIRRQKPPPFDVVYAIMGHGTELFEMAEQKGALKIMDASSSHPTSFFGFWQRECDLWCPGHRVPLPQWLFARCNRELERADLILCPSKFVRESMIFNGIPEAKCKLNPYGVDVSTFTPRPALPQRARFVCVGSICLRKGHQYLFRAFEKVKRTLPDAELVCLGNIFPDFKRELPRWRNTFQHFENVPPVEVARILRDSTAFVFPSNEEGLARAIVEAMASGLPIIATHQSGATTLVEDGVEGVIVRARDVDHIAEAMVRLATNRELNQKMGQAAQARASSYSTWGDHAKGIIEICEEVLTKRKQTALRG
jgi:glycosyltransferase involved in cell wall biosynthesis